MNFVLDLLKTTQTIIRLGVVIAAGVLYLTKPDKDTLEKDVNSAIVSKADNGVVVSKAGNDDVVSKAANGIVNIVGNMMNTAVIKTSDIIVKDYILVRYAQVTLLGGTKYRYLGFLQKWHSLD